MGGGLKTSPPPSLHESRNLNFLKRPIFRKLAEKFIPHCLKRSSLGQFHTLHINIHVCMIYIYIYPLYIALGSMYVCIFVCMFESYLASERMDRFEKFFFC